MDGVASPEASGQAEPGRFNETLFTRTTTLGWHNVTMINLEDLYLDIDSVRMVSWFNTSARGLIPSGFVARESGR